MEKNGSFIFVVERGQSGDVGRLFLAKPHVAQFRAEFVGELAHALGFADSGRAPEHKTQLQRAQTFD